MSRSISNYDPAFSTKQITNITWGAGGNTLVIVDSNLTTNSQVEIWPTGTVANSGNWAYNYTVPGQVTITSSNSESSTLTLAYYIN